MEGINYDYLIACNHSIYEYEKEVLGRLFPDEKDPQYRVKGRYEDIISKLLDGKG